MRFEKVVVDFLCVCVEEKTSNVARGLENLTIHFPLSTCPGILLQRHCTTVQVVAHFTTKIPSCIKNKYSQSSVIPVSYYVQHYVELLDTGYNVNVSSRSSEHTYSSAQISPQLKTTRKSRFAINEAISAPDDTRLLKYTV